MGGMEQPDLARQIAAARARGGQGAGDPVRARPAAADCVHPLARRRGADRARTGARSRPVRVPRSAAGCRPHRAARRGRVPELVVRGGDPEGARPRPVPAPRTPRHRARAAAADCRRRSRGGAGRLCVDLYAEPARRRARGTGARGTSRAEPDRGAARRRHAVAVDGPLVSADRRTDGPQRIVGSRPGRALSFTIGW